MVYTKPAPKTANMAKYVIPEARIVVINYVLCPCSIANIVIDPEI